MKKPRIEKVEITSGAYWVLQVPDPDFVLVTWYLGKTFSEALVELEHWCAQRIKA